MGVWKFLFGGVEVDGGSYNVSNGTIKHPPKGKGKVKVKTKTKYEPGKKKK